MFLATILAVFIAFVATQITTIKAQPRRCPFGWTSGGSRRCYLVVSGGSDFESSRGFCRGFGGDMVWLESQDEGQLVDALASGSGVGTYWIGLLKSGSTWTWIDGSPLTFTNWRGREPDGCCGPNVSCAMAGYRQGFSGQWDDTGCNRTPPRLQGYVCKRR